LKRGEIWTVSGGADYTGKPRPALVIQDDIFVDSPSVTICMFTTDKADAPATRLAFAPDNQNNLNAPSNLMIDKIITVPRTKMGKQVGMLLETDVTRVNRALALFLGLANSSW
jgi:mRNA interferase MazF